MVKKIIKTISRIIILILIFASLGILLSDPEFYNYQVSARDNFSILIVILIFAYYSLGQKRRFDKIFSLIVLSALGIIYLMILIGPNQPILMFLLIFVPILILICYFSFGYPKPFGEFLTEKIIPPVGVTLSGLMALWAFIFAIAIVAGIVWFLIWLSTKIF